MQGESRTVGLPTVFVRLTGCPLRCQYCDSEYAFFGGERMALDEILAKVASYKPRHICVTGGEPLAQKPCLGLLTALCDAGYEVSIETSGAMPLTGIDERVVVVMDLKTPGSKEAGRNIYRNISLLGKKDQIKFVVCDRADYEWARFKISEYNLLEQVGDVLVSPSFGQVDATDLANWIVEDNLQVRFQLQLHKLLWGDEPGY